MRVTGGSLRGRRVTVPSRGVRPTSDRVRESLFATLGALDSLCVLDLYAGSGGLGIESLSRGAGFAVFVDHATQSHSSVVENLSRFELTASARAIRSDVGRALQRLAREGRRFDLVFADPPYASDEVGRVLPALVRSGLLAGSARVIVERDRRLEVEAVVGLDLERERVYGDTVVMHFRSASGSGG